jgi:Putative metal-binding motif
MRKLCAWLGAATLLLVCSIASGDSGTALKPYVTLILDTSGSMSEATGFGSPTCGAHCSTHTNTLCTTTANCPVSETCVAPPDQKFFHAKCAIGNIANSYGDIVFALARYRANLGGAVSGEFPAGCTAAPPTCNAADNQFQLLSSLVDGGNSAAASWVNFTGNSCDGTGTDPEIWNDPSNTPLGGSLLGAQRYYEGLQASDGTTTIWPSSSAGFDPILNDPTNSVFVGPANCDPSATCTTNCCTSQCRPYITILLTDGQETCGGDAPTAAAGMFNYSNVHAIKITNITRSAANVVTVNTTSRHFLAVGDSVVIASNVRGSATGNALYNGTFTVATVASATRFTYTQAGGALAQATGGYAAKNDPIAIATIVRAGNVVTVTTAATHNLQPTQSVVIAGVAGFNGTFVVLTATATTLTYAQTAANASTAGGTASHAALLYDYDVQTKVIGFGVAPGDPGIEAIAHGGGAPDVPLVNEGYYAADQAGLELAISDIIAKSVRSETCNNLDDDCDTRIDEDFPTKGAACTNNEKGVCLVNGVNVCRADGTGVQCDAGTADSPDCATQPDGTPCTVTNAASATVNGKCSNSICDPFLVQGTAIEICNGLDDDCDGKIDEGLTGCTCSPQAELCNAADDNCDGHPDQTCTCSVGGATCKTGADCGAGSCVCVPLVRNCGTGTCLGTQTCGDTNGDGTFDTANGTWGACNAPQACTGTGPDCGICDGKDNDCDGVCDGFTLGCSDIVTPGGPSTDNPGDPTNNPIPQNVCHPGQKNCPQSCAGTNSFSACSGEEKGCNPSQDGSVHCDLCDGLDNDCDNKIDEDFVPSPCSSNCGVGMTVCMNGHISCDAMPATTDNTCDHIDDDCDGNFDEDWVCDSSAGCTGPNCCVCGSGTTCEKTECINGVPTCTTTQPIDPESCNCLDDDCDGKIDEGALCGGGADCVNCQCAFRCSPGEFPCPLSKKCSADNYCINDPCFGVTCPDMNGSKQACKDNGNNTASCVDICTVTTCADPLKCFPPTGDCLPDDCTTYPDRCSATENCVAGVCVGNPCSGVTCPADQYCESGNCINSCAGVDCPLGKRCRLGVCETDPCPHGCPYGKVCNDTSGVCVDDPCTFRDCQKGQWCNPNDGLCEDDPCVGTMCPDPSQVCKGGTCYDPNTFLPDSGIESHVTVGGGGCNTSGDGTSALFGLGFGLLLWRRRGAR